MTDDFMRLGVFGGSFDPVHFGHLQLAEACKAQARLKEVWWMPAARQPLKLRGPIASENDRCAMIEVAIANRTGMRLSRLELERAGTSYTVETLRALATEQPRDELFLLLGADSLAELPQWRAPDEICRLATPLVVVRPGDAVNFDLLEGVVAEERLEKFRASRIDMPPVEVSSSEIRRRIAHGDPIAGLTPIEVIEYIADHHLYGAIDRA